MRGIISLLEHQNYYITKSDIVKKKINKVENKEAVASAAAS